MNRLRFDNLVLGLQEPADMLAIDAIVVNYETPGHRANRPLNIERFLEAHRAREAVGRNEIQDHGNTTIRQ
jgi:hypothetical protein